MMKDFLSEAVRMLRKMRAYRRRYEKRVRSSVISDVAVHVLSAGHGEDVFCSEHRKCGATFPAALPCGRYCEGSALIPVMESEEIRDA